MKIEDNLPSFRSADDTSVDQHDQIDSNLPVNYRPSFLAPFNDATFQLGFILLSLSATLFLLYDILSDPRREAGGNVGMIMIHYGLAVGFSILLLTTGFYKTGREDYCGRRPTRWLGLLLWLISAYALNREMAVFQQSTTWLCWALVAIGLAMVVYTWKESLSIRGQQLLYAVFAFGFLLFVYMAFYLVKLYPISVPMLIGLGLSIHTFVPFALALALGKRLWIDTRQEEHLRPGVTVGLCATIAVVSVFLTGWFRTLNRIEQTKQEATIRKTSDLPDWVLVAQHLKPGWITDRLLLSGRVYDQGRFFSGSKWGLGNLTSLDDVKRHDPLVVIASVLHPANVVSDKEKLALLKIRSSERHGTEEKFWMGRHLTTEEVVSQVRIWPQFRLSYTEQTVRIRNQARNTTEEALFTFHLPAGSAVSSMSLWVNGKEESAYLTTVAKADSAYRTVVDVQSRVMARDPAVVYWQEGNRVTVRVFPCRAGEDRRVKLGITSPLRLENNTLVYQNPYFEGPDAESATELVNIDFTTPPTDLNVPWLFSNLTNNTLRHQGDYNPDWALRFQAPPLSTEAFVLDGRTYQMELYRPTLESFTPTDVFLDVNVQWSEAEFRTAYQAAVQEKSRVWVFMDGMHQLSDQNLDATYEQLKSQSFSLFPVYRIANPETSLLITKGTPTSPLLSDLRNSPFADHFGLLAKHETPIRTFCLNPMPSPYIQSLNELRVLNVTQGTSADLVQFLGQTHQFPHHPDQADRIVLSGAGVAIREQLNTGVVSSKAPNHLARLFSYTHLLQQIGRHYFVKNYQTDTLITEAQRANVVSPLSSLIVLETTADYDRFGIKKDHLGLDNATFKEEGAVPEPHEWAMLIMVLGLLSYLSWKKHYALR
ncbi:XrtN system VIT domain-containing protein [Spirosoma validum]|uniref:XrtN system VIT domain-containing protein n=1 Tax=Spirosoma validum TaxID=2771355 RepID=A0A927GCM9_9BACT|nr:XrtN system VIT domain-containing protein [Spirosoma validum]MBD2752829.1 XrtN system VIT domain-containing protein [Spirosoma validum]